ncbi:hypothetical protein CEQ90_18870 [Lewinellaceae bacterium SD302]|nr:hypothetical protein CEQ90_18870 [Lewinellaceae bacterium SD302]
MSLVASTLPNPFWLNWPRITTGLKKRKHRLPETLSSWSIAVMFRRIGLGLLLIVALFVCYLYWQSIRSADSAVYLKAATTPTAVLEESQLQRIAFGSCNKQNESQAYWETIAATNPDQWIWLGDNIYGDSDDPGVLRQKYELQQSSPEYRSFISGLEVYGIYDDHDYGLNDGGKEWHLKDTAASLMLDFLNVPANAPVRSYPGTYQTYLLGEGNRQVRLILLDTRYFRDGLKKSSDPGQRYEINDSGDVLGEAQWSWLEKTLGENEAAITLIGTSIQFITDEHPYEKWSLFPTAKSRMLELLAHTRTENVFLLSGDRHLGEIAEATISLRPKAEGGERNHQPGYFVSPKNEAVPGYKIAEITSSGLTHSYENADESNRFRSGALVGDKNFGLLTIDWSEENEPILLFQLLSTEDGHEFNRLAYAAGSRFPADREGALSFLTNDMTRVLKPCPESPNCVSTQTSQEKKKMQPLKYTGELPAALAKLKSVVEEMSRTKLIETDENYLHFTFKTFPIPFIDDVEFLFDDATKQIHYRSASRVGHSDLGVNARRMKKIARRWNEVTAN